MNSYNSSLTNTYSDRQALPLSRSERTVISKETLLVSEFVREGQQMRGEIINRTTTDVTIRLSTGQTLQARLDVSVPLSIGQMASFEITHADPALISLRILQDEAAFAQNALIQKALTAAELPVTSRNAELVNTLLQHNLPISKESILLLIRQSNTYPNADINTLALLTQHRLPVTQASLTQFEAYQNYEHQILPQLANLAHSLSELAASSAPSLSGLTQLLQNLLNQTTPPEAALQTSASTSDAEFVMQNQGTDLATVTPAPMLSFHTEGADATTLQSASGTEAFTATVQNQANVTEAAARTPLQTLPSANTEANSAETGADSANLLPSTEHVSADTVTTPEQNNFVQALLTRWTLSPKELADSDKVKEFYRQLREDLTEIHEALRSTRNKETTESPLERILSDTASATGRLQDNLEFMNMLNRIFPYVQLPIRFSDKTAHGELYVYTKKEKLRGESGSISVLLHLDMDALGPTDIYLSLTGNQLNSRFYLDNPSLEELFTEHLPELKETLTEKGFSVSFELVPRKQEKDPVREFLNSHDTSGLSRFTFDCRA